MCQILDQYRASSIDFGGAHMISDILSSIVLGAVLGVLARFILPGKQNISIITTILAGMVAAFVGTLLARLFGVHDTNGIDWWERLFQVVLALVAVTFAARRFPTKTRSNPTPPTGTPPRAGM
jgi:uncharacterized membrane protein YeaQ/YmgE (transglycosylase-associated protein family)